MQTRNHDWQASFVHVVRQLKYLESAMMVQTLKSKNYVQCKCVDEIIAEMLLQQQPEELDRRTAPPDIVPRNCR